MCVHLLLREIQIYNCLLNNRQQENVGSHQKKIPHIQGKRRSPSKMVGGMKSSLESNPIPARDAWRAQTNLVCTRTQRPHRDQARTVFVSCGGTGQQQPATGAGSLGSDLGMVSAFLNEVAINPTTEPSELTQDWGNRLLRVQTKPCMHQDSEERSSDPARV